MTPVLYLCFAIRTGVFKTMLNQAFDTDYEYGIKNSKSVSEIPRFVRCRFCNVI